MNGCQYESDRGEWVAYLEDEEVGAAATKHEAQTLMLHAEVELELGCVLAE